MESWKPKSMQEPSFVKVLLHENFTSQLRISKEEITDWNGGKFWKRIFVKGSVSKKLHEIGVEFSELSVTLKEGWNDFVEKNTLQRNDILVFFNEELNLFNVTICNKTGKVVREKRGSENEEETIGLNNGSFPNNFEKGGPSGKSGKRKDFSDNESCFEIHKKGRIEEEIQFSSENICSGENQISQDTAPKTNKGKNIVDQSSESEIEGSESDSIESWNSDSDSFDSDSYDSSESDSIKEVTVKKAKCIFRSERILKSNRKPVTKEEKNSAKRKAEKFKSEKPTFMMEMKERNVYKDFNVTVPINFAREFFPKIKSTEVWLKLAEKDGNKNNGKKWQVNCHHTFSNNQDQWRFFSGWKDFSFKNNLEESDCCVFELTKRKMKNGEAMFEFTVHIFRVVEKIVKLVESTIRKYNKNVN